jgi:hypothetical protein
MIQETFLIFTEKKIQAGAVNTIIEDLLFNIFDDYTTENCLNLVEKAAKMSVARLIVDSRFPTKTQQDIFQDKINRYTQALKLAFRGMLNQVGNFGHTTILLVFSWTG